MAELIINVWSQTSDKEQEKSHRNAQNTDDDIRDQRIRLLEEEKNYSAPPSSKIFTKVSKSAISAEGTLLKGFKKGGK
jgi:hypothetical protein